MWIGKVSAKGWVVIPKELRKKYGLKPGSLVNFVDWGENIAVMPIPENPVAALRGMLTASGTSGTEELLRERALDREREEAKIAYWMKRDGDAD